MFSVGEALRRARVEQKLDLATVAARTKISVRYLEAIESDDRKALPSSFFYKSFVDQYARALSLDTREIGAEVDRLLSADAPLPLPGQENAELRGLSPVTVGSRFPRRNLYATLAAFAALTLVVGACSAVYVWWHSQRTAVAAKNQPAPKPMVAPAVTAPAPPSPPPAEEKSPVGAVPESVAQPEAASSSSPSSPAPSPGVNAKVLLDLMAREVTWLSVSSDGKPVFSGLLKPNESKTVEGEKFAKIRVGNAGGLEVRLNGRPLGTLGERGQVLVVVFTPDNFQIVQVPKESD